MQSSKRRINKSRFPGRPQSIQPEEHRPPRQAIVVEVEINQQVYRENLEELLTLDWDEVLRTVSISDIEFHLAQCARFHAMMSTAWSEALEQKELSSMDLEVWYGEVSMDAEGEIRRHRKRNDIGSTGITKEQCLAQVISSQNRRDEYVRLRSDVAAWNRKEVLMRSLMKSMENFGMHLQSLLKHKDQERAMASDL